MNKAYEMQRLQWYCNKIKENSQIKDICDKYEKRINNIFNMEEIEINQLRRELEKIMCHKFY